MNYQFTLDPSPKKYRCPRCNKKTLVKFINARTGELNNGNYGRCDRESKCGFFERPEGENLMEFKYVYKTPKPVSYHDDSLISRSGRNFKQNNFIQYVKYLFGDCATKEVIKRYLIGTSKKWNGATIFWQIDNHEKVRHGKIMLYDANSGKRKKNQSGKAYISSVRSELKLKDFNLQQCLFGLHLINETQSRSVAIVESEKTAILMSIFKPEYIWLATGSKNGFKYEYLKPLRNYSIIGFPDKGEYGYWSEKAIYLNSIGFNITINKWLEDTNYDKGTDLADVLTKERFYEKINPKKKSVEKPADIINTPTEIIVKKLASKNPQIINLVRVFDLTDNNGTEIRV